MTELEQILQDEHDRVPIDDPQERQALAYARRRLQAAILDPSGAATSRRRAARRSRRPLAAAGALLTAVCVLVLLVLSSGSAPTLAQAFPIFQTPATTIPRAGLAGILRSLGTGASAATLDVHRAHAFRTPVGTGYVVTDRSRQTICLAAPGFARSWGASCGPVRDARRDGGSDLLQYSAAAGPRVAVVDLLPRGATATLRRADGDIRRLAIRDGMLTVVAPTAGRIMVHVPGRATVTVQLRPAGG